MDFYRLQLGYDLSVFDAKLNELFYYGKFMNIVIIVHFLKYF